MGEIWHRACRDAGHRCGDVVDHQRTRHGTRAAGNAAQHSRSTATGTFGGRPRKGCVSGTASTDVTALRLTANVATLAGPGEVVFAGPPSGWKGLNDVNCSLAMPPRARSLREAILPSPAPAQESLARSQGWSRNYLPEY